MKIEMKKCSKCQITKSKSEFCKCTKAKDGLNYWCRACNSQSGKEYRKKQVSNFDSIVQNRWQSINQRTINGCYSAPKSPQAKSYIEKGIRIEMTKDEFVMWMYDNKDKHDEIVNTGQKSSIDRIDPNLGYSISNIRLIPLHDNIEARYNKSCKQGGYNLKDKEHNRKSYLKFKNIS